MKIRVPFGLVIGLIPLILFLLVFAFGYSIVSWQVKTDFTSEDKVYLAQKALIPELADYVERTGTRGFQDVDLQIETCAFSSVDELCAALPPEAEDVVRRVFDSTPESAADLKRKRVKEYKIDSICPFDNRNSLLPLDLGIVDKYELMKYWEWDYSVYEYKDGTYRFVVLVRPR